jgi:hypothetical protein
MLLACLAAPAAHAASSTPSNLVATPGNNSVSLSWSAPSGLSGFGVSGYRVKRSTTSGGPYTLIASPKATAHADTAAANGTLYFYVVAAVRFGRETANSAQASARPVAPAAVPSAPTGVTATAGNAQVALSWAASSGATGYRVKRATSNGGPYTQVSAPTGTSYSDASLTNGVAYYYVVTAINAAGESVNSALATATPQAPVTPPTTGTTLSGLHVVGNQIRNGSNQTVSLRGVNKAGTEYMCLGGPLVFDGPSDAASVTVLKSWAINIVRLPINEDCWLGINGVAVGGTAYRNAIVNYVNLLTAGNIATIIDLQWAAPGTTVSNQLTPMPDADHAPAFWSSVASTFKSNSSVIFDLFNEPWPDSNRDTVAAWTCLRYGGTCAGISYQVAGMQSLVDAVRATGSTNIVMVPGLQYANLLTQWLAYRPNDATGNLVAAWHSYATQGCNNQACWDTYIKPVLQAVPVITGEIGQSDCQASYVNPLMAYLDANGGHYLAWAWNTYDCASFPSLLSNYNGTPTAFGAGIRDHYLAMASGTPPVPPASTFFSSTYPFGIAVGSTTRYTASDGTIYYPDVAATGLSQGLQYFTPFTTNDAISGTADPSLYRQGRQGITGSWTINVPNGTYQVTLGMAPNSSFNAGEFGQDQNVQGQKAGTCVWSRYSGSNISPTSGTACPGNATPVPANGVAYTVTYTAVVSNQQLSIQPAASFGGGRTTMLNTIRVAKVQ